MNTSSYHTRTHTKKVTGHRSTERGGGGVVYGQKEGHGSDKGNRVNCREKQEENGSKSNNGYVISSVSPNE